MALAPLAASAIQLLGKVSSAISVPLSAAAQLAGGEPENTRNSAEAPTAVSMASRRALRTVTES
jgi:hypothetical protein